MIQRFFIQLIELYNEKLSFTDLNIKGAMYPTYSNLSDKKINKDDKKERIL